MSVWTQPDLHVYCCSPLLTLRPLLSGSLASPFFKPLCGLHADGRSVECASPGHVCGWSIESDLARLITLLSDSQTGLRARLEVTFSSLP